MKGIFYLWKTTIKNRILQLRNHPTQFIAYIIFFALLCFVLISSMFTSTVIPSDYHDLSELKAMMLVLAMFAAYSAINRGLSSGSSFFGLHDANLLFTAPISPKKILLYGLVRQMSASLIASLFILFQAMILKERYNITLGKLLLLLLAYFLILFVCEIGAMIIYMFTNGHDRRKKIVRTAIYLTLTPFLASFVLNAMQSAAPLTAAIATLNAGWVDLYPFIGWITGAAFSFIEGQYLYAGLLFSVSLLSVLLLISLIARTKIDYYEDVLQATEKQFYFMEAAKEGRISDSKSADKIKMKDRLGIRHGRGGSAIFYKHMLENKRSGYLFFDNTSLLQVVAMSIFALINKSPSGLLMVFIFSIFFQLFTQSASRWIKELMLPYIFLIPVSPFIKLIYACMESVLKCVLDGILIFIPVGILLQASPLDISACILARAGFGILFIAGNVLSEKVLGTLSNKGLLVTFYLLLMGILTMPGVLVAVIVPGMVPAYFGFALALAITFVWNIGISAVIIGLCRNILHNTNISTSMQ
jgi:hypothetical protein